MQVPPNTDAKGPWSDGIKGLCLPYSFAWLQRQLIRSSLTTWQLKYFELLSLGLPAEADFVRRSTVIIDKILLEQRTVWRKTSQKLLNHPLMKSPKYRPRTVSGGSWYLWLPITLVPYGRPESSLQSGFLGGEDSPNLRRVSYHSLPDRGLPEFATINADFF